MTAKKKVTATKATQKKEDALPLYIRGRCFWNACMDCDPYSMKHMPEGFEERLKASPEIVKKFNQKELGEVVWDTSQGFKYDSEDSIPLICWAYGIKAEDFLKGYLKKSDLPTAKELEELETRLYEEIFKYSPSLPPESYAEAKSEYLVANEVSAINSLFKFYAAYLVRVLIPLMREAIIQSDTIESEKMKAKKEQEKNELQQKIQYFQEQIENLKSQL